MNYRNDNATPRDRINEDFFQKMLSDEGYNIESEKMHGHDEYPGFDERRKFVNVSAGYPGNTFIEKCGRSRYQKIDNNDCRCSRKKDIGMCEYVRWEDTNNNGFGCKTSIESRMRSSNKKMQCDDKFTVPKLDGVPLAMVYSPFQEWKNIYETEDALDHGTIFMELDFPFYPISCGRNNCRHEK